MKRNLVKMEEHVKMVSPATSALALLDSMEKIVKTVSQFVTSFLFVYKFFYYFSGLSNISISVL